MDKLSLSYRRQITCTGLACALGFCMPHITAPLAAQESIIQKEIKRRAANAVKAHELLKTGDTAYEKQDYKAAVKDYSQAFSLLPTSSKTEEIRVIAGVRYATAATELARKLAKNGDYEAARNLLDAVTKPEVAPTHLGALKLRGEIEDPTRYNHALTPEHVRDITKVARHLREAEGFLSLGQYDRATTLYRSVLSIDPYNTAARRGMEKVSTAKSDYARSAQDQTRAELLGRVDQQWELSAHSASSNTPALPLTTTNDFAPDIRDRLAGITIDVVDFQNISISEAIDFIRIQSRLGDTPGPDREQTGINIILNTGDETTDTAKRIANARITLKLSNVPLSKLIDYVTDQTHTQWRTDGVGILITPLGATDGLLVSRSFRVPPNFITSASTQQSADAGNIFDSASNDGGGGKLPSKISITDFLTQNGITFPDGAAANYTPSNNTLFVRNTATNIDLVDQLVSLSADTEPVLVKVQTTIMRVAESKIKELGFDWAISPISLSGSTLLSGGTLGNGLGIGLDTTGGIGSTETVDPVTSGNRSGSTTNNGNNIDALINARNTGQVTSSTARAPGILALTYVGSGVQVQMLMRGLNQQTGSDVLVNPSVIMRSGERSKIDIIREFTYPTEYEPPELPNTTTTTTFIDFTTGETAVSSPGTVVTPATPTAFETRNVGVSLEVEPTVGPNKNYIELSLSPEFVEFDGFINYGSPINGASATNVAVNFALLGTGNAFTTTGGTFGEVTENAILMPVFSTIRIPNSSLTIQDGHTIVLGGVTTTSKRKVEDKIPLLGDIPYLGRLFRTEAEDTFREAVIISVSVELIDPSGKPWRDR